MTGATTSTNSVDEPYLEYQPATASQGSLASRDDEPSPTSVDPTPDTQSADLPSINIPNPNLPGHGPHLPHAHFGGGHHHF